MKQKIKKVFENAVWWSGVVMFGLVLGLSLQFVKAWTEPTVAPPGGNVGAPINTSPIGQFKQGVLQLLGLTVYNNPDLNGDGIIDNDVTGKVLTAQNANGAVAWAAGGGGGGGIYTHWGYDTCVGSDTIIYKGEAVWPNQVSVGASLVCLDGVIGPPGSLILYEDAGNTAWYDNHYTGGNGLQLKCAVCVR